MKKILLLLFFVFPMLGYAQNLTGTWEGSGGGVTYIKMVIKHVGDSIYGYTYDEGGGYCKATFAARYTKPEKRLRGRGLRIITNSGSHVLASYDLVYSREPGGEFLRERVVSHGFLDRLFSGSRQYLKKTSNKTDIPKVPARQQQRQAPPITSVPKVARPVTKPAPPKPIITKPPPPVVKKEKEKVKVTEKPVTQPSQKPVVPPVVRATPAPQIETKVEKPAPVAVLKTKNERSSKLVETIYTSMDTVRMSVYDNGEVDGDTVTVFFDNSIILDKFRISEKGKEVLIPVSKNGKPHVIELFANNLGTIPPNTALIILTAGSRRYELRASYDLQTNARIVIQYKD